MKNIESCAKEQLLGCTCHNYRFVEGGTLILYFVSTQNNDRFGKRLWIDCAWRIIVDETIKIGSLDESEEILNVLDCLVGRSIESLSLSIPSGDLRLVFSSKAMIESFGYSVLSESWELRRSDGFRAGIGPHFTPYEKMEKPDQ